MFKERTGIEAVSQSVRRTHSIAIGLYFCLFGKLLTNDCLNFMLRIRRVRNLSQRARNMVHHNPFREQSNMSDNFSHKYFADAVIAFPVQCVRNLLSAGC